MNVKACLSSVMGLWLLFGLILEAFFVCNLVAASPAVIIETVTYDYYVVGGYLTEPTPPSSLAPSPSGFQITCDPPFYNAGNVTLTSMEGFWEDTPVQVNITNQLGYDVVITELMAEVTNGTPTLEWYHTHTGKNYGNFSCIGFDALDPWDPNTPPSLVFDEVNYTTGEVKVVRDGDEVVMAIGSPYPDTMAEWAARNPSSLLQPDKKGDAEATNHTAPIRLANNATFTEYFGARVYGHLMPYTEMKGTITLSLTYEYEPPPGAPIASFTYTPTAPLLNEIVTFNGTTSTPNGGNLTDPDSYLWNFGDGTTDTGQITTHQYVTSGNFTVLLNLTDTEGLWSVTYALVTIAGPPTARFTYSPAEPTVDQTLTFNASTSHDPDDDIVTYAWDFGDGTAENGKVVTHHYSAPGNYTVLVTVMDSRGLSDTESTRITIRVAPGFPWLWVGVGAIAIIVVIALVAVARRMRK